ncbi:Vault protein inter-alpha-trypsin [Phycisphaerae bacterium RAS1]|nr:Vault protein inter-alpha-trypsin [Phycisphaerae bacterium RAS1]
MFPRILLAALLPLAAFTTALAQPPEKAGCGELRIIGPNPDESTVCPLKHTTVEADVAGIVGRVTVKQTFTNPSSRKIEAVYVFPLPADAAVDDFVMQIGSRRVIGQIKERDEARKIYEQAKNAGHVASLLDQERPNIFTQSVANIDPGVEVVIEITYVETLRYEAGAFEWSFPMVVGPRYIPGGGSAPGPMTTGQPTPQVPDAGRITPPVTPQGTRAGHDISLSLRINTGLPLTDVRCESHEIDQSQLALGRVLSTTIALRNQAAIPNRDFVVRYRLGGEGIGDAFLFHQDPRGGYFTLVLQPPARVEPTAIVPRELIFVLDTSGSMSGYPIEKAKKVVMLAMESMLPADSFNLITFAGDTHILWDKPRPNTPANRGEAISFLQSRSGGGGTEMMKAIEAALVKTTRAPREGAAPIRVVCFLTDGYVGNDAQIINFVKKNAATTRVFSLGIGNSVNRYLLDGMARAGRGEVEYVLLESSADAAVQRLHERMRAPVLTDISLDWGGLPVSEVFPPMIPDLFAARPVIVHGRLAPGAAGSVTLRGYTGAGPFQRSVRIETPLPSTMEVRTNPAVASLWARSKVDYLMANQQAATLNGEPVTDVRAAVTQLGLEYRLMTQFTSFVAVEEQTITRDGQAVKVLVPVEMPSGVSYTGVFGGREDEGGAMKLHGAGLGMVPAPASQVPSISTPTSPPMPVAAGLPEPANGASRHDAPTGGVIGGGAGRGTAEERQKEADKKASKLAPELHGLAEIVAREGKDGDWRGRAVVTKFRVSVMITVVDFNAGTLEQLAKLGFEKSGENALARVYVGMIDVRRLGELEKLDQVVQVAAAPPG